MCPTDSSQQISLLKNEINEIMEHKTRGAMLRCKSKWVHAGEKPSSYFLGMEKRQRNSSTIDVLIKDGSRATFRADIQREQTKFYKTLHQSRKGELSPAPDYLTNVTIPKISDLQRMSLDDPIVLEEIIESIHFL